MVMLARNWDGSGGADQERKRCIIFHLNGCGTEVVSNPCNAKSKSSARTQAPHKSWTFRNIGCGGGRKPCIRQHLGGGVGWVWYILTDP